MGRRRHQGTALVRSVERKANGHARNPAPVRSEYSCCDRRRETGFRPYRLANSSGREAAVAGRPISGFIYAALHEINIHLIVGSILASLVVFLFMRNWRAMFIAAVAIPSSLTAAFGAMWALHFTLNSVTMLALVLMVGIVIDDALVVLENTFRFMEEKKLESFEAARVATADIGHAVLATTLSLVVIFIPVSFMSSIAGRFLYQFRITADAAVLVSLLISFTLTPMMCARMLRVSGAADGHQARSRQGFYRWVDV